MTTLLNDRGLAANKRMWEGMAAAAHGRSDSDYRDEISRCAKADEELKALRGTLVELESKIDADVQQHADTCAPIQLELADEATSTARRIELRMLINSANAELKASVDSLKPRIKAIKDEIENQTSIAAHRPGIENAFAANLPDALKERVSILRQCHDSMKAVLFRWEREAVNASSMVANEKERLAKERRPKYELAELEKNARLADGVHGMIAGWVREVYAEIGQIRADRLKELYQK